METTKATHTPGPWKITDLPWAKDENAIYIEAGGDLIGEVLTYGMRRADGTANALLFAAAPDLLEACKAMIEWDDRERDHAVDFGERSKLCERAFDLARAAIAKATDA